MRGTLAVVGVELGTTADDVKKAQQALLRLMDDDAAQVRQHVKKALDQFFPGGRDTP